MNDIVRVATVEDQRGIREGLRFFIDNAPGFRCTGCFGSVEEALPALTPASVDIVLMDLGAARDVGHRRHSRHQGAPPDAEAGRAHRLRRR